MVHYEEKVLDAIVGNKATERVSKGNCMTAIIFKEMSKLLTSSIEQ